MDEALLAATSPHGNTPAEIYATIRDNALAECHAIAEREPNKYAIAAEIRKLMERT